MLAKTVEKGEKDWDQRLPYVHFVYRVSQQQSTLESPFFLLYGRDPRLPTDSLLCPSKTKKLVGLQEYGQDLVSKMSEAWDLARKCVGCAQQRQKQCYGRRQRPPTFQVSDLAFLFKPVEKTREARKFARPFHGPFRIIEIDTNTAKIRRVEEEPILVAIDKLRRCPAEIADEYWPPDKKKKKQKTSTPIAENVVTGVVPSTMSPSPSDSDDGHATLPAEETKRISGNLDASEDCQAEIQVDEIPTSTLEPQPSLDGTEADSPSSRPAEQEPEIEIQETQDTGLEPGTPTATGGQWAGRLRPHPKRKRKPSEDACG